MQFDLGEPSESRPMRSCLVVDDSSIMRKVARRILEDMDYVVDEAEDGQEAYDKCQAKMPDSILLDWHMPIKSGLDFLRELRGYEGGDYPKVVFCTSENDIGHIAMALKLGANEYILKPFDRDILEAKFSGLWAPGARGELARKAI